jgi:hypothetical protein
VGIVHIQFADDLKTGLLVHLRELFTISTEVSDDDLYTQWMGDLAESFGNHFLRRAGKFSREQTGDSWIFVESRWACTHHKMLGYEALMQEWEDDTPYLDSDTPLEITRSPYWLRRMIVLVWQPVGFGQ